MLAIFNTIGQLVGGLCRDHTIAKGLSLKFATSGGLELAAQWAGRQSEGLATAFEKGVYLLRDDKFPNNVLPTAFETIGRWSI